MRGFILIAVAALMLLASCRTPCKEPLPALTYIHDTICRERAALRIDTIIERDSVALLLRGDTIYQYRERECTRIKLRVDTIVRKEVEKRVLTRRVEVEKPLSRWQRIKLNTGGAALALTGLLLLIAAAKLIRRLRR